MTENPGKIYDPKATEAAAMDVWAKGDHFHADPSAESAKGTYCIVIPPPNVTAALHLGHALNNTLQDVLIRFKRMQEFNTLWMPGTDHAGIATQTVVDKRLRHEGKPSLVDYRKIQAEGGNGREEFIAHVQAWKDEYEACIIGQLKSMGCSCDWERVRFTMDKTCAKAVRKNFFDLFKDGLICLDKRLVNWDPVTQTVLADDEVEHEIIHGHFWYLKYPLVEAVEIDGKVIETITVATTRPETMLGDTAVAMNPSDPKAKALVGKMVKLPIVGREIPIIADEHVVMPNPESDDDKAKFSTGFLKVTPAHDPDDYAIGQRHLNEIADAIKPEDSGNPWNYTSPKDIVFINIMAPDASISDKHGWNDCNTAEAQNLLGMDRFEARTEIEKWFIQEDLLEDKRDYVHEVGHSYRSHVPIEPYLSDQWYVQVNKAVPRLTKDFGKGKIKGTGVYANSLAGIALKPLLDEDLKFTPERYANTYRNWLENLRDWPISRQLWWGHQIPIWSKSMADFDLDKATFVDTDELAFMHINSNDNDYMCVCIAPGNEDIEKQYEESGWGRDEDVLDTWFSSALWPFSTLGWPDVEKPEFKTYYPGNVLCTAREIITLWVSRMVMMGQYCTKKVPFTDVYIHAMIQDGKGRKMSKSLGNGIDPLVAIDSHGADAMRFTLASMTTDTQDVRMPVAPMELPDGRTVNTSPKFDVGRNFCNKLWNASRFAMMNLEGMDVDKFDASKMVAADKWILSRLANTVSDVTALLENFKYNEPLNSIYKFFWNDLCDWYLEWAKPRMNDDEQKDTAQNVLAFVLDQTLRLLHPFVPFITEGIFQGLNDISAVRGLKGLTEVTAADAIIVAKWPCGMDGFKDSDVEGEIGTVQSVIKSIREIRSQYGISPKERLKASVKAPEGTATVLLGNIGLICQLAGLAEFAAGTGEEKPANAAGAIVEEMQVYLHDVIDPEAERKRLEKQKEQIVKGLRGVEGKLGNENFVSRAKPEVVAQAKAKLAELTEQLAAIEKYLGELQ